MPPVAGNTGVVGAISRLTVAGNTRVIGAITRLTVARNTGVDGTMCLPVAGGTTPVTKSTTNQKVLRQQQKISCNNKTSLLAAKNTAP